MSSFTLQGLLLSFLLLANLTIAGRYSFSIEEVHVDEVRDWTEDDLLLAIASTADNSTIKNSWIVGEVYANDTITANDTVKFAQEIDVPETASNLSVAIGGMNMADEDEELAYKFVEGLAAVAVSAIPGPQAALASRLLNLVLGFIGDPTNCTGPVIIGTAVYTSEQMNKLEQNQNTCETRSFEYEVPLLCSPTGENSSYTVTYCLERLDAKVEVESAAAISSPGLAVLMTSFAVALLYSGLGTLSQAVERRILVDERPLRDVFSFLPWVAWLYVVDMGCSYAF